MWIIVVIVVVVGYLLLRPMPIGKRIKKLNAFITNIQPYLVKEYAEAIKHQEKEMFENSKKFDNYSEWREVDEKSLKLHKQRKDDFVALIELNAHLSEKYRDDQQKLWEQLADWATFLSIERDITVDHNVNSEMLEQGYDPSILNDISSSPEKETEWANRRAQIVGILERIKARAVESNVPHKALDDMLRAMNKGK